MSASDADRQPGGISMIREDRELLTELARLSRELAPLAMRIMEGSANASEQLEYAQHLIAAGEWLRATS